MFTFSAKDLPFFFTEQLDKFSIIPFVWDSTRANGFGENISSLLWLRSFIYIPSSFLHNLFNFDWFQITIFYYFLFIFFALISIRTFTSFFEIKNIFIKIFFGIIFITNTYTAMLLDGGQLGVLLAYSLVPLVFTLFSNVVTKKTHRFIDVIDAGIILALQLLIDIRIALLTVFCIFLYWIIHIFLFPDKINFLKLILKYRTSSFIIVFLLHLFWIIPSLISFMTSSQFNVPSDSRQTGQYFSFAKFENAIALLHPNWPENIFGKVYFMKPEFLIIPLAVFSVLLLIDLRNKEKTKNILFFCLLSIIGIFLAKGTNEPFGFIYTYMLHYIPGFVFFRDPTKWYILIAFSYSFLLSFVVSTFVGYIKSKLIKQCILLIIFLVFLSPSISVIPPDRNSALRIKEVPSSYVQLKDFLINKDFSRTFWIPERQTFGYYDAMHPAINGNEYMKEFVPETIAKKLISKKYEYMFKEQSIRYVIVPEDTNGELFLSDRKFDQRKYRKVITALDSIDWLKKIETFGSIQVYEIYEPMTLFWDANTKMNFPGSMVNQTTYTVNVAKQNRTKLIFSTGFDPHWEARMNDKIIHPKSYKTLTAFNLPTEANEVFITYNIQPIVRFWFFSSCMLFLLIIVARYIMWRRNI